MSWNGALKSREKITDRFMEVLTTYVREHASIKRTIKTKKTEIISAPRADIQAILTVIGRRGRTFKKGEDERLYLFRTDLVKANLTFAHLEGRPEAGGCLPARMFRQQVCSVFTYSSSLAKSCGLFSAAIIVSSYW